MQPSSLVTAKQSVAATASSNPWLGASRRLALVAGVFCLLLGLLLIVSRFQSRAYDPLNSVELTKLKAALAKQPQDEQLIKQIRALDLKLRQQLDRHQRLMNQGGWLLLGGALVFLFSIKQATYRKKLPRPPKRKIDMATTSRTLKQASWSVAVFGLVTGGAAWILSSHPETSLARLSAASPATTEPKPTDSWLQPATPYPTVDEWQRNWPRFRGPNGSGVAAYTNYPASWNTQTGENILWKVKVPVPGPSSPVVWANRLFITSATAKQREVSCYDTASGKLLWRKTVGDVPGTDPEPPTVMEDSGGYAPSTPATDGRRVYAMYANGDVAAFDYNGQAVWAINLGKLDNSYGHSTSLAQYQDRLIIQLDQGGPKDGKSKVLALDTATGKIAWQSAVRPVPNSWSTPIVIHTGQKEQLITCANPWVIAYNPADGAELWRAQTLYGEVTPSPIFAGGFVLTVNEGEKLSALRPDGAGDVTKTHVAWTADEGLPDICSPVSDGQRVYLLTSGGTLTCYELASGKKLWDKEFEIGFKSSPSSAGNRLYLFSDTGTAIQVQTGSEFQELGRSEMGEEIMASPAFADGRFFVRAKETLFCIGSKGK